MLNLCLYVAFLCNISYIFSGYSNIPIPNFRIRISKQFQPYERCFICFSVTNFVKSQQQFMIITQRFRVYALWCGYCCHTVGLFVALSAFVQATLGLRRLWFELRGDSNANFTNLKRFFRISISQLKHDRKLTLLYADSVSAKWTVWNSAFVIVYLGVSTYAVAIYTYMTFCTWFLSYLDLHLKIGALRQKERP